MRILMLAGHGPSLINFRGALLEELIALGHEVHCVAPMIDADVERALHQIGCRVHHTMLARNQIGISSDLSYCWRILALTRRFDFDVAFAYTIKPVVYGLLACLLGRVRLRVALITGLGYAFIDGEGRNAVRVIAKLLYRLSLTFTHRVIFQNTDDRDLFVRLGLVGSERTRVVSGSGVDTKRFAPIPVHQHSMTFLMIARLLRDKGVYEYVGAARRVRAKHPDARFLLVGPLDPNPAAVRPEDLEAWESEKIVEYRGSVDDVRPALAECTVYVLPSYREGTPRTVLEAMSVGRAIVTTDAAGCRETVIPGVNGFLVPARSELALADCLERFLAEPELAARMGEASRRYVEERYAIDTVNAETLQAMGLLNSGSPKVQ